MKPQLIRCTVLIVCLLLAAAAPALANTRDESGPTPLSSLDVGDVVAQGTHQGDACCFEEPVWIRVDAPANFTGTIESSFEVDDECRARLASVQTTGVDTSAEVSRFHARAGLPSLPPDTPLAGTESTTTTSSTSGSKTVTNSVYHYGTGGQSDKLTEIIDEITFSYDGTDATITDSVGPNCYTHDGDYTIDECARDRILTSGDPVYKKSHGTFHETSIWTWSDYKHTLYSEVRGYASGNAACYYSWDGEIVSGVDNTCTIT